MITVKKRIEICNELGAVPICNFEDYIVNKKGEIYQINPGTEKVKDISKVILKYTKKGIPIYRLVDLKDNSNVLEIPLDKLVLNTFIGDLEGKIIHKDGDYKNCKLKNLKYELIVDKKDDEIIINNKIFKKLNLVKNIHKEYYISEEGIVYNSFFNELLPKTIENLYYVIKLYDRDYLIHRLVFTTWIQTIDSQLIISHLDGHKGNNHHTNLSINTKLSKDVDKEKDTKKESNLELNNDDNIHNLCKLLEKNSPYTDIFKQFKILHDKVKIKKLKSLILDITLKRKYVDISSNYKVNKFDGKSLNDKEYQELIHQICRLKEECVDISDICYLVKRKKDFVNKVLSGKEGREISREYNFMKYKKKII